jgi:hypothetical protein
MKAIFEVEFKCADMCDRVVLKEQYDNSWFKCIKHLYEFESMGMFNADPKLLEVK